MGDSSEEDTESPNKGAGGGENGRKSVSPRMLFSPERLKGLSVKSVDNNSVVQVTLEETLENVNSFIKELGETEGDNALKETAKLLRGKGLRYGNVANAEQSSESDVSFVDQIEAMINGVSFGGVNVFKNFM